MRLQSNKRRRNSKRQGSSLSNSYVQLEQRQLLASTDIDFTGAQLFDIKVDIVGDHYMGGSGGLVRRSDQQAPYVSEPGIGGIVFKHDHDGDMLWAVKFSGVSSSNQVVGESSVLSIEIEPVTNNIIARGQFKGTVNFGNGFTFTSTNPNVFQGFIATLDECGNSTNGTTTLGVVVTAQIPGQGDGFEMDALGTEYRFDPNPVPNQPDFQRITKFWKLNFTNTTSATPNQTLIIRTLPSTGTYCGQPVNRIQALIGTTVLGEYVADIVDGIEVTGTPLTNTLELDFARFMPELECRVKFNGVGSTSGDVLRILDDAQKSFSSTTDFSHGDVPFDGVWYPYTVQLSEASSGNIAFLDVSATIKRIDFVNVLQTNFDTTDGIGNIPFTDPLANTTEFPNPRSNTGTAPPRVGLSPLVYRVSGIGDSSVGGVFFRSAGTRPGLFSAVTINSQLAGAIHFNFDLRTSSVPETSMGSATVNVPAITPARHVVFSSYTNRWVFNGNTPAGDMNMVVTSDTTFPNASRARFGTSLSNFYSPSLVDNVEYNGGSSATTFDARNFAGVVVARSGGGDDFIYGGSGNDTLQGQGGKDRLDAGDGNDILFGDDNSTDSTAHDILIGGNGNDTLYGYSGNDYLRGDSGNDQIYGGSGSDNLVFWGTTAADNIVGSIFSGNKIKLTRTSFDEDTFHPETDTATNFGADRFSIYGFDGNDVIDVRAIESLIISTNNLVDGGTGVDTFKRTRPWLWALVGIENQE